MIQILIVEDQTVLRDSLSHVLDFQDDMKVIGVTNDASKSLQLCHELKPDLVLMDVVTENNANGITFAAQIRSELPDIKIVIMTAFPDMTFVDEARKAGAHSYFYKKFENEHLAYMIRNTMKGMSVYLCPSDSPPSFNQLTEREIKVIRLVSLGKSRNEIHKELGISETTLKPIITSILNKTGFDTIMEFVIYAVGKGLIVPIKMENIKEEDTDIS